MASRRSGDVNGDGGVGGAALSDEMVCVDGRMDVGCLGAGRCMASTATERKNGGDG